MKGSILLIREREFFFFNETSLFFKTDYLYTAFYTQSLVSPFKFNSRNSVGFYFLYFWKRVFWSQAMCAGGSPHLSFNYIDFVFFASARIAIVRLLNAHYKYDEHWYLVIIDKIMALFAMMASV